MKDLLIRTVLSPLTLSHPSPSPWGPSGLWLMRQRRLNGALGTREVEAKLWLLLLLQMVSLLDRPEREQDFIPSCDQRGESFCQSPGSRGSSRWGEWDSCL